MTISLGLFITLVIFAFIGLAFVLMILVAAICGISATIQANKEMKELQRRKEKYGWGSTDKHI